MLFLGVPATVSYEGAGFTTGLKGIYAYVRRPDKTMFGPLVFDEGLMFASGQYFSEFTAGPDDPEGRYTVMIYSPQENRRATAVVEYLKRPVELISLTVDQPAAVEITTEDPASIVLDMPASQAIGVTSGESVAIEVDCDPTVGVDIRPTVTQVHSEPDGQSVDIELEHD